MSVTMFDDLLKKYETHEGDSYKAAVREIMQYLALAGLHRGGFFKKAAFYGGTCLKIVYDLDRFSEDLDFTLLTPDPNFTLEPWFESIREEFLTLGHKVDIGRKVKSRRSFIDSRASQGKDRIC